MWVTSISLTLQPSQGSVTEAGPVVSWHFQSESSSAFSSVSHGHPWGTLLGWEEGWVLPCTESSREEEQKNDRVASGNVARGQEEETALQLHVPCDKEVPIALKILPDVLTSEAKVSWKMAVTTVTWRQMEVLTSPFPPRNAQRGSSLVTSRHTQPWLPPLSRTAQRPPLRPSRGHPQAVLAGGEAQQTAGVLSPAPHPEEVAQKLPQCGRSGRGQAH